MVPRMRSDLRVDGIVKLITFLIGSIGFLSIVQHVSYLYSLLFISLLIASAVFEKNKTFLLPRWALNSAAVLFIVFTFLNMNYANLIEKMIEMFIFLLAVKFLEDKKTRDHLQIYTISVFLLLGSALLSTDLLFLLYFLSLVFLFTVAIVLLAYLSEEPDLSLGKDVLFKIVSKALLIPAAAIPLTVVFFIVLPRPFSPLLKVLTPGQKAMTGFSEDINLGMVSEIQEDTGTIFRAEMKEIPSSKLYWRGIVFDHFDGQSWKMSDKREMVKLGKQLLKGERVEQTIYLEPYNYKYLFALDRPVLINRSRTSKVFTYTLPQSPDKRIKYDAVSVLDETIYEDEINEETYLQLPDDFSEKITDLAIRITSGKNAQEKMNLILSFFSDEKFKYSMEGLPVSSKPLEDFLFDLKSGNCEYFASSMALMLRASGVPARVVGGYKGADYNEVGGYYLVQQRNAHVWVEAYMNGLGWVRVDPTPSSREVLIRRYQSGLFFKLRMALDVVNYFWNGFVIDYDLRKQFSLFMRLGQGIKSPGLDIDLSAGKKSAGGYIVIFVPVFLFVIIIYRILTKKTRAEIKMIRKFHKRMLRYGYERSPSEGLDEFLLRIDDEGIRLKASAFVADFNAIYYKDQGFTRARIKRLHEKIKAIKPD